ncbi:MAG TPA: glycosyltransferase [Sphingomicrobium sp.]|jgi:alpha-1,6-mannosyltransferase|nr:glycosyltransferase [Sphingomicrobium sp.]
MRIVDVCAFYAPTGGGVRTYVEAKLKAAARFGHEVIVLAPGEHHEVVKRGPGAFLVTIPAPKLPVDRRYRYFDDERTLHAALDAWQPDHVEASSPWSSATMVGRWQGAASRSLVMHADPLAAYAYRWLGGVVSIDRIDRMFSWFWRHLRGLGQLFDTVVCANDHLAGRLRAGGVVNAETVGMGVEAGVFSPSLRCHSLREQALRGLGLEPSATLLLGVGRFSAEKRWNMVMRAVGEVGRKRPVGMLLVGDGSKRIGLELLANRTRHVAVLPRISDRAELARLMACADALVHGCEAETFCLVAAEARASGVPLIVPDRGATVDQLVSGAGTAFRAGSQISLERAIKRFLDRGPELQRAAAVRASHVRTMDEHFAELFARYQSLVPRHVVLSDARMEIAVGDVAPTAALGS